MSSVGCPASRTMLRPANKNLARNSGPSREGPVTRRWLLEGGTAGNATVGRETAAGRPAGVAAWERLNGCNDRVTARKGPLLRRAASAPDCHSMGEAGDQ
jgi:hypothetical protein